MSYQNRVSESKLGAIQFGAPSAAGSTRVPSGFGYLSSLAIGRPRESTPDAQLLSMKGAVRKFLPVARSSTKKYPLRLACASNLRLAPWKFASHNPGVSTASHS